MIEELVKGKVYYKIFNKVSKSLFNNQVINDNHHILYDFAAKKLLLLNQIHGNQIFEADNTVVNLNLLPEADASITTEKGLVLGICTADCVPVLLASEDGSVIGAAHCGWRSAKLDIIRNLVQKMRQKADVKRIVAVIGPSISQQSYEVSSEYYQDFLTESMSYKKFFIQSSKHEHYMFDLPAFVKMKLSEAQVELVKQIDEDTYTAKDKYPSYRRHIHTGEAWDHCILSAIVRRA